MLTVSTRARRRASALLSVAAACAVFAPAVSASAVGTPGSELLPAQQLAAFFPTPVKNIVAMPDGTLDALTTDGSLYNVAADGSTATLVAFVPTPVQSGLAVDELGDVFGVSTGTVWEFNDGLGQFNLLGADLSAHYSGVAYRNGVLYYGAQGYATLNAIDLTNNNAPSTVTSNVNVTDVAVTSDGGFIVNDDALMAIFTYAADGTMTSIRPSLSGYGQIAVAGDDTLWAVRSTDGTVDHYPSNLAPIPDAFPQLNVLPGASGLAIGADGTLYLGNGGIGQGITRIATVHDQTVSFTQDDVTYGDTPTLTATATSGLPVTFTSQTPDVCTVTTDGALTTVAGGDCTIAADQSGSTNYHPAPQATATFAVLPAGQTITFAQPGGVLRGSSEWLSATATSNLPVTFTSQTPSTCSVTSDGLLTGVAKGNCTVAADQAGNGNYAAAPTVTRTLPVTVNHPPTVPDPRAHQESGSTITVPLKATDPDGDPVTLRLTPSGCSTVKQHTRAMCATVAQPPSAVTATLSGSNLTLTAPASFSGRANITVYAIDGRGARTTAVVTDTVTPGTLTHVVARGANRPGRATVSWKRSPVAGARYRVTVNGRTAVASTSGTRVTVHADVADRIAVRVLGAAGTVSAPVVVRPHHLRWTVVHFADRSSDLTPAEVRTLTREARALVRAGYTSVRLDATVIGIGTDALAQARNATVAQILATAGLTVSARAVHHDPRGGPQQRKVVITLE